ncbi:tyrosine-type recombinase/integrase [Microtetraspora malaysiensis]|uniref:tyrosine-type recombinase/integrase n=1 Tax=Microtetraspora malaysiensis TaxID=161358 RepID=UPI003D8EA318
MTCVSPFGDQSVAEPQPPTGRPANERLSEKDWTPREMRHSFASPMSDSGVPIENISRLVGHSSTRVTETVYRKQLRPLLLEGAEAMDRIFSEGSP